MLIDDMTGINWEDRQKLINRYAKLNETEKLDVHKLQIELMRQGQKKQNQSVEEYVYCHLILAISKRFATLNIIHRKNKPLTDQQAEQIWKMKRDAIIGGEKKKEGKIGTLIRNKFYPTIVKLRAENPPMSWIDIGKYIQKWNRKKISHTYLKKIFEKISVKQKKEGI